MTPRKKQHLRWHKELKAFFEKLNICWCEKCGTTEPPLDMAHSKKRYDIHTREEYFEAAMLCRNDHNIIEWSDNMREQILGLIRKRDVSTAN